MQHCRNSGFGASKERKCVRIATTISAGWKQSLADACLRLVHPDVSADDRPVQARLIGLSLVAPFVVFLAAAPLLASGGNASSVMAALFGAFAAGWGAALFIAWTGRPRPWFALPVIAAMAGLALLLALSGGAGTPLAILALALPIETKWLGAGQKTVRAALAGGLAVLAAGSLGAQVLGGASVANAAAWVGPFVYGLSLWVRRKEFTTAVTDDDSGLVRLADQLGAAAVRSDASGQVDFLSPPDVAGFGGDLSLLAGNGLFQRLHVADRVLFLSALGDVRNGASAARCVLRLRLPAGEGYTHFNADFLDRPAGPVILLRPNAEALALEKAERRADEAGSETEIAKSRFLAAVSHELRTPLNAIIGFSDMLLHEMFGGFSDPRQKEYVGLISQSGQHLLSVVNAILDVSKIESGSYAIAPEPFRLADAAAMCLSMVQTQAGAKAIEIATSIPDDLGDVTADCRAVQQMMINLLSNAVKFTPDNGRVILSAFAAGTNLTIEVSDNGIGMDAADLERIGRPFTQVQNELTRQYEGTGLGLSLVKGLVALHGGAMSIESAPGRGTSVRITLPDALSAENLPQAGATSVRKKGSNGHEAFRKAG